MKQLFSFEIFPPKKESGTKNIFKTLEELQELKPDFISVTYGAGGSTGTDTTVEAAVHIKEKYRIDPLVHLPCLYMTKEKILRLLEKFHEAGIMNVLALRGDMHGDIEPEKDFRYASELIQFIKGYNPNFNIFGACYPEIHPESESVFSDINALKIKAQTGVSNLITQFFFDNDVFYRFLERARLAGINIPIEAGIMPVINSRQIERIVSSCKVSMPRKLINIIEKYKDSPQALTDAGIAYSLNQIVDLVSNGVDGIHLYTMNNVSAARRISEAAGSLFRS